MLKYKALVCHQLALEEHNALDTKKSNSESRPVQGSFSHPLLSRPGILPSAFLLLFLVCSFSKFHRFLHHFILNFIILIRQRQPEILGSSGGDIVRMEQVFVPEIEIQRVTINAHVCFLVSVCLVLSVSVCVYFSLFIVLVCISKFI